MVNGDVKADSMVTMLLNDFGTLKSDIEASQLYESVLVFEIPETAAAIEQLELNINIGEESYRIEI